jgi:undecaprenyl-diphosphatase
MVVFFFHKKWSFLFFVGAVLIGIARVIAGIHWPIDILGGAIIGILSAHGVLFICKKWLDNLL